MTEVVESFLRKFFGEDNDLKPETLATTNPLLAEWLDRRLAALRRKPLAPTFLPRRRGATVSWYGLAHSPRDRRQLVEAVQAFVGPTFGAIRLDRPLDPRDAVDAAAQAFAASAFTVDVLTGQQAEVRQALDLFFQLQEERPHRQVVVSRPLGRLLREFEMAVLAGSIELSADLLADIEMTGQLSAQNLIFLRVRRLVGLRNFREVMDLPELATILSIRRPSRVTAALFDALYATELAVFEARGDAVAALTHFREKVLPQYPALFRSRQGVQTSAAMKVYALYAASAHPDEQRNLSPLAAAYDLAPGERQYVNDIARLVSAPAVREATLIAAIDAARAGDFDVALELAREIPPTTPRAELLVRCAIEIDSLEAMNLARDAVNELEEADRARITLSRLYAAPWARIERILGGDEGRASPATWLAWFELATSSASFDNALEVAERSVVEWTSEALTAADSQAISQLLNRDLPVSSLRRIKDALPYLLQFIDRVSDGARHRALLDDLSTLLLLDDVPSVADASVLVTLVASLFEVGATAERRRELVQDFAALFARVDAAAYLDVAIDLFDTVLTFAASDETPRDMALATLLSAVQRWRRRVHPEQWLIVHSLAAEVGAAGAVSELVPDVVGDAARDTISNRGALRGKVVAIYTLTESAGGRARDFLLRNFDGVSVELASDHVATERLVRLASTADLFVVAVRSAKHAATICIEAQRPSNRPPVYASGKGSVSLVRAVLGAL